MIIIADHADKAKDYGLLVGTSEIAQRAHLFAVRTPQGTYLIVKSRWTKPPLRPVRATTLQRHISKTLAHLS